QIVLLSQCVTEHQTKRLWSMTGIGISKQEPLSTGERDPGMQGVCLPRPAVGQLVHTMHLDALIPSGPFSQEMRSGIGRAIIDEGDIEVWIILPQQRSNTCIDSGFFITYRHNDRNVWRRFWQRHLTWWVCFSDGAVCAMAL